MARCLLRSADVVIGRASAGVRAHLVNAAGGAGFVFRVAETMGVRGREEPDAVSVSGETG